MATLVELQTYLAQAKAAKHAILTGKKTTELDYQGRKVRYSDSSSDRAQLDIYIRDLEIQIARLQGGKGRSAIPVRF